MKPLVVALAGVVLIMTAACGGGSPASTTPVGPSSAISVSGPAPAVQSIGGTTTWSCFAGSRAGIFAAAGCAGPLMIGAQRIHTLAGVPSPPTALQFTVAGSTVTLNWSYQPDQNPNAGSFVVEAGSASGLSNLASFDTGSSATSLTVSQVPTGTYYVRVRGQSFGPVVGGPSNEVVITVGPVGCVGGPDAPSGLAGTVSGPTVTLTWTAPRGGCSPTSYNLQAGSSSGLSNLASFNTGSTATTYVATGVPAGTYYVRVVAVNATGQSASSIEIVVPVGGTTSPNLTGVWTSTGGPYLLVVSFQHIGTSSSEIQASARMESRRQEDRWVAQDAHSAHRLRSAGDEGASATTGFTV